MFWRKNNKKKIDFSGYSFKLSIKAMCYFEKMMHKPYGKCKEEDMPQLLYCIFIASNPYVNITFNVFSRMLGEENVAKWVMRNLNDEMEFISQFAEHQSEDDDDDSAEHYITDIATSLIIDYGMDADYVMNTMRFWEITPFYEAVDTHVKNHLEEQRLWTYIGIAPHIDGNKIKGPDDILPFTWEKEEKKKKMEKEFAAAQKFFSNTQKKES